jgi:hypothetical protein
VSAASSHITIHRIGKTFCYIAPTSRDAAKRLNFITDQPQRARWFLQKFHFIFQRRYLSPAGAGEALLKLNSARSRPVPTLRWRG